MVTKYRYFIGYIILFFIHEIYKNIHLVQYSSRATNADIMHGDGCSVEY